MIDKDHHGTGFGARPVIAPHRIASYVSANVRLIDGVQEARREVGHEFVDLLNPPPCSHLGRS